jgi:hypothetical protein
MLGNTILGGNREGLTWSAAAGDVIKTSSAASGAGEDD